MARRRVLYLYNEHGWAIHHVGLQWASTVTATHDFHCVRFGEHERLDPDAYDRVMHGYSTMGYSGRMWLAALTRHPHRWWRWRRPDRDRRVVVVHDPSELFPEHPRWRTLAPRLGHLARFGRIATASRELEAVLAGHGLDVVRVPTRSRLPVRTPSAVQAGPLAVYSRAQRYPRKDLPLLARLADFARANGLSFDLDIGGPVRTTAEYTDRLDAHSLYVCTSWQEGGPLPLLDAMRRGCAVLTTRVGQTDEWVEDGVTGYFCTAEAEFRQRLMELAGDPSRLLAMRRAALARAAALDHEPVRQGLERLLA